MPIEEALQNISTQTQFIQIADGADYAGEIPLIDENDNGVVIQTKGESGGKSFLAKTIWGQEFSVHTLPAEKKTESDYILQT